MTEYKVELNGTVIEEGTRYEWDGRPKYACVAVAWKPEAREERKGADGTVPYEGGEGIRFPFVMAMDDTTKEWGEDEEIAPFVWVKADVTYC
jgi:hypothetical protein